MKFPQSSHLRVYLAAFSCTLAPLSLGTSFGWTSPMLPKLMAADSPVQITADEGSWIVSFTPVGLIFSPLIFNLLLNRVGRKATLLIAAIPFIIGWILVLVADSVGHFYACRFLFGLGTGITFSVTPIYLAEIAPDMVRGSVGIIMVIMLNVGYVLAYAVGPFVSIKAFAGIALVMPTIFISTFIWFPDTPYYLIYKNRLDDAISSLQRLRGYEDVKSELDVIHKSVQKDLENTATFKQTIQSRSNWRGLLIVCSLVTFQQLTGNVTVIAYCETILERADGFLSGTVSTIILGVVQLMASVASSSAVDRLGRRPLLLISTCGIGATTAAVGVYFYLKEVVGSDVSHLSWLPLTGLIIHFVSYAFGMGTVPFAMGAELFPTNIKGFAISCAVITSSVVLFVVMKVFQVLADEWGLYVCFWMFSSSMILATIFVYFVVPETKGKSFMQIQAELSGKKCDTGKA